MEQPKAGGRIGVSRDEVVWCYRSLLRREPESEDVIRAHMANRDFRSMVEAFVSSSEFQQPRGGGSAPPISPSYKFHPLALPSMEIDLHADENQLARALAKVRAAWSHLGRVKPHFSVITDEHFLPQNFAAASDRFWKSGEDDAEMAERMRQRHDRRSAARLTCVEYGCGVGRVTMGFARRFARVHGYDISPEHLKLARARAAELQVANVVLHDCSTSFPGDLAGCDFFFSRIVFQHNPPPIIAELVKAALRSLNPAGIAIFQLPVFRHGYRFKLEPWLRNERAPDMEMHCLPQDHVFALIAEAGCVPLEVREDGAAGEPDAFISNTFVVRRPA
jgi:SAM-dependent methyltransferase